MQYIILWIIDGKSEKNCIPAWFGFFKKLSFMLDLWIYTDISGVVVMIMCCNQFILFYVCDGFMNEKRSVKVEPLRFLGF